MMMNIFSNFDPMWFNICYKSSIASIMPLMAMMTSFWLNYSPTIILTTPMKMYITLQMKKTKLVHLKSLLIIMMSMFIMIMYMNIHSLLPYLFSMSSHITVTLSLGLPLWALLIMSSTSLSMKKTTGHLLPSSAPLWLNPFLVIIESISVMVRPLTLSFRLAANMTAGHIILSLMSTFSSVPTMMTLIMMTLLSSMYTIFELGICLIQAYIFCLLVSLYSNDHS